MLDKDKNYVCFCVPSSIIPGTLAHSSVSVKMVTNEYRMNT